MKTSIVMIHVKRLSKQSKEKKKKGIWKKGRVAHPVMKAVAAVQHTDVVRVHVLMTNDAGILHVQLQPPHKGGVRLSSHKTLVKHRMFCFLLLHIAENKTLEQGADKER